MNTRSYGSNFLSTNKLNTKETSERQDERPEEKMKWQKNELKWGEVMGADQS